MSARISRRAALRAGTLAAGATLLPRLGPRSGLNAQTQPIRFGGLFTLTGPQVSLGAPQQIGARIVVDQVNRAGGLLGRQIEMTYRDDKANPNEAVAIAREYIGSDIQLMVGGLFTATVLALGPVLLEEKGVLLTTGSSADSVTHENFRPSVFRTTDNSYERYRAQARDLLQRYPDVTEWGGAIYDAEYAWSAWREFSGGLREFSGGKVKLSEPVLAKFGAANDFKNQVSTLTASPVQGLFIVFSGEEALTFYQQARGFGLIDKVKVLVDAGSGLVTPKAFGKKYPITNWTSDHWYYGAHQDNELSRQLYKDYVEATKDQYPTGYVEPPHAAILAYAAAIKMTGSTDAPTLIKALEGLSWDSAKGKRSFRKEDHQSIGAIDLMQISPSDNADGWTVSQYSVIDGAGVLEPPSPGVALKAAP